MSFDFKHKDYTIFSYPTLATFEKFLQRSVKDSTLTNKEKANARTELKRVQAAMKSK